LDEDGRISLLDASITVATSLANADALFQTPVVVGDADRVALFASRSRVPREYGTVHALLIGVNSYSLPHMQLQGPVNDVTRVEATLRTKDRRLFRKASVRALRNADATATNVKEAVARAAAAAASDDVILVYFSGHGSKSVSDEKANALGPGLFLVLHDFQTNTSPQAGILSSSELTAELAPSRARYKLIVLDF
jgi:hypothetical protein